MVFSCLSRGSVPVLSLSPQTIARCISSHHASLLTSAPHICILRSPSRSILALRNLCSIRVTPPCPRSIPHLLKESVRTFPVLFSRSAQRVFLFFWVFGWRGAKAGLSATLGCISRVFLCARPTAFPLTSP